VWLGEQAVPVSERPQEAAVRVAGGQANARWVSAGGCAAVLYRSSVGGGGAVQGSVLVH
jgi:hypothetical protein